jgi:glycosyltransferase involved in cell wall biosynthesis
MELNSSNKKIVFVLSQNDMGGHTRFCLHLSKLLIKNGFQCVIYVPFFTHYYYTKNYRASRNFRSLIIWVRYFLGQTKLEITTRHLRFMGSKMNISPVKIKRYFVSPNYNKLKAFDIFISSSHWQLAELDNKKMDLKKIIHVIHHIHTHDRTDLDKRFLQNKVSFIVSSKRTALEAENVGINVSKLISLGVDLDVFNPRKKSSKISSKKIGFFYYPNERKNPKLIIEVINLISNWNNQIEIHVFGNNFNTNRGNVYTHERLNEDEYSSLIANLDLFVYISRVEGFGLPPLEAMASGVAVISSDVGAVPEYIESGKDGVILPSHANSNTYFNKIVEIIDDNEYRKYLSLNAREKTKNWTWEKTYEKYLQVISNL